MVVKFNWVTYSVADRHIIPSHPLPDTGNQLQMGTSSVVMVQDDNQCRLCDMAVVGKRVHMNCEQNYMALMADLFMQVTYPLGKLYGIRYGG